MVSSFARIGAALKVDLSSEAHGAKEGGYFPEGKRWKLRLHEKGGKEHLVPVHHTLEEYLDGARIRDQRDGPLFRTLSTAPGRPLSLEPMTQPDARRMTRRRARNAGIATKIGCHTSALRSLAEEGPPLCRHQEWSQYVDYWAVDWNYKGDTFHNEWQTYRTRKNPKLETTTTRTYNEPGKYTVLVKVIDILGNDTTKALEVEVR